MADEHCNHTFQVGFVCAGCGISLELRNKPVRDWNAADDELARMRAALAEIAALAPYPEDIWTPLTSAEEEAVRGAISASGIAFPLDRSYAQWGRYIGHQYREIARKALAGADA